MENTANENEAEELRTHQEASSEITEAVTPMLPDVSKVQECSEKIKSNIATALVGQSSMVELLLVGLFTEGHILLEGLPGIAKTLAAKLLAGSISASFSRIQFTPDLMPSDITGTSVYNLKESEFSFRPGPIFAQIVLIDEVNRAPAKTQAALMEVMEERQMTHDGTTYPMPRPFLVIATQNPIEQEGTYALPEAQLDRFVFKVKVSFPSLEEEIRILNTFKNKYLQSKTADIKAVVNEADIIECSKAIEQVHIRTELLDYIAQIVHNTRNNGDIFLGASPRASLAIMQSSKAIAAMRGRGFVTPDDIKSVAIPALNHRLILSHEREMEGVSVESVIQEILKEVEIPR